MSCFVMILLSEGIPSVYSGLLRKVIKQSEGIVSLGFLNETLFGLERLGSIFFVDQPSRLGKSYFRSDRPRLKELLKHTVRFLHRGKDFGDFLIFLLGLVEL